MKIKCRTCGKLYDTLPQWQYSEFDLEREATDKIPKVKPTPNLPDECMKLLDNGWNVMLYKNQLGSYTASARNKSSGRHEVTDDFTPSKALYRLTEKVFGNIV